MPSSEVSSTKLINSISAATSSAVSRSSHSGSTFLRTCVTLCDQHLLVKLLELAEVKRKVLATWRILLFASHLTYVPTVLCSLE